MADPPNPPAPPFPIPDHELIRPIGHGSYGEVWLGKNVLGDYRAVKFVRRGAFEHDRPVEREFEGIKMFEPISRSHESHVHVLHVGRHPDGFYYVMELADDANAPPDGQGSTQPDWENYVPKTLRSEMQRRGRLPFDECLEIALRLTQGLAHLHEQRLVHRDIKPSNIIFVRGQPKLADIGLVAPSDATMSYVGTEGFLPPEGPGRPQADLYSLGKVLYEISTGRDRHDFPELPTALREDPQRKLLEEFNEVVLKACEPNPRQRYQTAGAMQADLELLRAGKSLQRKRSRERAQTVLWKAAAVVALTAGIGFALASIRSNDLKNEVRHLLPVRLAVDNAAFWRIPEMPRQFDFSPEGERIVFAKDQDIFLWNKKTTITRRVEIKGLGAWRPAGTRGALAMPRWAPDGRQFLFQAGRAVGGAPEGPILAFSLFLVNAETGEAKRIGPEMAQEDRCAGITWRPDGHSITCLKKPHRLVSVSMTGEPTAWIETDLRPGWSALGDYSPDGSWLALSLEVGPRGPAADRDIWLVPHMGGRAVRLTERPGQDHCPTWGPDGESVYFVSQGGSKNSETQGIWKAPWDGRTGMAAGPLTGVFQRKGAKYFHPKLVADGRTLAYAVEEPDSHVRTSEAAAMDRATELVRGKDPVLSPDGETVYFVGERWDQRGVFAINRTGDPASLRKITGLSPIGSGMTRSGLGLSPDGEQLALSSDDGNQHGVFIVSVASGETRFVDALPPKENVVPVWSPDGAWLAWSVGDEIRRLPRDGITPESLATLTGCAGYSLRWSPDGAHLAAFGYSRPEDREEKVGVFIVSLADKSVRKLTPDSEPQWKEGLEWHPRGQFITYMRYGPEKLSAQIRRAWLDGRPTDLMIDQPDYWDYLGIWEPSGRRYFFRGFAERDGIGFTFDSDTAKITPDVWDGNLPQWSRDGRQVVWADETPLRYFEVSEDFRQ